jgi:hypothetical protein
MRTVTVIYRDCGVHFKLSRTDSRYRLLRHWRRETKKMPVACCPKCMDATFIRRNESFRAAGAVARRASENANNSRNFHSRLRVRSWAWRELDD